MPNDLISPDAGRFGLASFADILPSRDPIVGEDPGSFDGFHDGMMQSLAPMTPYECVVAENLIAIEWELLQHRRMRDAGLRQHIRKIIKSAVVERQKQLHEVELDAAWEAHLAAGGVEANWETPYRFDRAVAEAVGDDLARRAVSSDRDAQEQAYAEITELGLEPVEVMGEAYRSMDRSITKHDQQLPDLERRRREVKRDFDMLQRARPEEAEVIEG
ncbi:MAG: hypothetical protein ACSHX3_16860 [Litorimonas sp.]